MRCPNLLMLSSAILLLWSNAVLAEQTSAQPGMTDDSLDAPDGATADDLIGFLQRLSRRSQVRFRTRDETLAYQRRVSRAKVRVANRLWKIGRNDAQLVAVVQAKADGLHTLGQLGDPVAREEVADFLDKMSKHENQAVAQAARRLKIQGIFATWNVLSDGEKSKVLADLTTLVASDANSLDNARFAANAANSIGDTRDTDYAVSLLEEILPRLKKSENAEVLGLLPTMEGLLRRLRLPGTFLEVDGVTDQGDQLDWDAYRGKVVLVDYWATWCGPCLAELPNIKENYDKYHEKGFEVVGVSLDDSEEAAKSFLANREIPWETILGESPETSGWNHPMAVRYGIRGIPRAILVDADGNVIHLNARGEVLGQLLQKQLGDPVARREPPAPQQTDAVAAQPQAAAH